MSMLVVTGLTKSYRRGNETVHALSGIDLVLEPGEIVALAGPSGSGKSTLVNILAGWERPDAGEVAWPDFATPTWTDVGVVPQALGLIDDLTVAENLELPMRLAGHTDGGEVERLLAALGLDALAGRVPSEISGGEQQRAAVARALVMRPSVVIADEPVAHQDDGFARRVMACIREAADAGTACLVTTHQLDGDFADRVLSIRDGRALAPSPPSAG
jgi:putative ABC transport system ATP-binding protein